MSTKIQAAADDMGFDSAEDLITMLEVHGLHLVTAPEKDRLDALTFSTAGGQTFTTCTLAERAVLDAAFAIPDVALHSPITHAENLFPLCDAIQRLRRGVQR